MTGSETAPRSVDSEISLDERRLFHVAVNSDEFPQHVPIIRRWVDAQLAGFRGPEMPSVDEGMDGLEQALRELRRSRREQAQSLLDIASACSIETCCQIVREYAPTGLLDGCMLQYAAGIALNHTEFGSMALKLYAHSVGGGYPARHRGAHYRDLLRSLQITLPDVASQSFTAETRFAAANIAIEDASFELALFNVGLSHFPGTLLPEIVGASLFHYVGGIPPLLVALGDRLRGLDANVRFLHEHTLSTEFDAQATLAVQAARSILAGSADIGGKPGPAYLDRIRCGLRCAAAVQERWQQRMVRIARGDGPTPRQRMERLVRERAPQIIGYHRRSVLEQLMKDGAQRPGQVVDWLASTRYIVRGSAATSPFLTELCAFEGPMFGAFSGEELEVIKAWIDQLPHEAPRGETLGPAVSLAAPPGKFATPPTAETTTTEPTSLTEAYHRLINFEPSLVDRQFAQRVVERWLEAGRMLSRGEADETAIQELEELSLPIEEYKLRHYSAENLDAIVERQHQLQVDLYQASRKSPVEPPPREALLEMLQSIAIFVLADGAWLQRTILTATAHGEIHSRLFRIYSDELGNGEPEMNHCNVVRRALEKAGVFLPDIRDPSFGEPLPEPHPRFFGPTVYCLAISLFPKRYLPELLGLNLAIELWGVGGQFAMAASNFRARNLDPLLFDLHNTIDNIGSGHAAWAKEAIRLFMDDMFAKGGDEFGQAAWQRVWTGFCSWSTRPYMTRPARQEALFIPAQGTGHRHPTASLLDIGA